MNPMRELYVDKVVVHMGVGEGGDKLSKAIDLMSQLVGAGAAKPRDIAEATRQRWGAS